MVYDFVSVRETQLEILSNIYRAILLARLVADVYAQQ